MKTSRLSAAVAACLPADPDAPVLMIGSHYDTVHDGGKYDGALGIIVGISAVKAVLLEVCGRAGGWYIWWVLAQLLLPLLAQLARLLRTHLLARVSPKLAAVCPTRLNDRRLR